jgi:hypothetical protein
MQPKALVLFAFFSVILLFQSHAQEAPVGPGSVVVYSEDGEKFTLYINGDRKNGEAASRVVATVNEEAVSFRVVFENAVPEVQRKGLRTGTNCLYAIEKNKKGERVLRVRSCSEDPIAGGTATGAPAAESAPVASTPEPASAPAQLKATYANGTITLNDGRTFTVQKVKVNGMTYPRLFFSVLQGAQVSIVYDDNKEKYSAESPMKYEVKDFSNNNAYFTLTVDEGGPEKTWHVKLQNANGYDLKIE